MKMKNLKLLIFVCLIVTKLFYAQSGWVWQNPTPTGNDYERVRFYDENTGYAVGWHGTIVKTTNGGENWTLVNNEVMNLIGSGYYSGILRCIHIFDQNTLIVAGNGIIKTTNSGINWQLISIAQVRDIQFVNNSIGFYINGNIIFKTTDGGFNWVGVSPIPGTWYSINFVNQNTGFVSGNNGNILKTTNAGANWNATNVGLSINLRSIKFANINTGYCAGDYDKIYKTTNEGQNWTLKFSSVTFNMGEISYVGTDTCYFTNWGGMVFRTYNGANTWDSVHVDVRGISLSSVKNNLFVVGTGGMIYKSSDYGVNWYNKTSTFGNLYTLNSIYFPSQSTGYICGEFGNVLKTTNTGINWIKLNTNITTTLTDIYFINDLTGFAVGAYGKTINSTNGGLSWDTLKSVNVYLTSVFFLNSLTGFISGNNYIYKTTNKGASWYIVNTSGGATSCIQFLNSSTGYSLGRVQGPTYETYVFKTTNQGESWFYVTNFYNLGYNSMQMINEYTGYAVESNLTRKTTNGGTNWFEILNYGSYAMYFINDNTGYITGFKTTNAGINWFSQNVDIQANYLMKDIFFVNSNTGFMVGGYGGTIFKTTDGGGTMIPIGLNNLSEALPLNYNVFQNYPNPFNPQTKIKFEVPKASFTKLIIYDLLGREVATLVNEELKPGTYEADWSANGGGSNFSSGVYFYKIISGDFVETKKMVLMK